MDWLAAAPEQVRERPRPARWVKRSIDIIVASIGLAALSPFLAVVAIVVRVSMGRPVLFRQVRPGHNARPFVLIKFRTMTDATDGSNLQHVPKVGSLLRRTSIDELPQLWNILRGDMSLVGPRPLSLEYLPLYTHDEARRHEAVPGLTGWAQVNGRHLLTWEERFRLDVWYVDNWSLRLDFKILAMTFRMLLAGAGEAPPPSADFGLDRVGNASATPISEDADRTIDAAGESGGSDTFT